MNGRNLFLSLTQPYKVGDVPILQLRKLKLRKSPRSHTVKGGRAHLHTQTPELLLFALYHVAFVRKDTKWSRRGICVMKAWGEAT